MNATNAQTGSEVAWHDPTPEQIFKIIDDVAKPLAAKCPDPGCGKPNCWYHSKGWKEAIFDALAKHLKGPGVEAFFHIKGNSECEFVLDFVLLEAEREKGLPKNIARTILGMEMEWTVNESDAGSEKDFNKVLCFNAPLKVFVYACYYKNEVRRINFKKSIEQSLRRFNSHRDGDRYLIVEFYQPLDSILWGKRPFRIENGVVREEGNP